ncbi:MAG: glycosyltransferase family protein [Anaerolineales bacterium]|nr:glycosyltransferase family protein [Anaerolineales bacterium]MCB8968218.1 glycosyltransferase family protein [Ardenticatenaceae bacterium]
MNNVKVVTVIQARVGSSRLPGKVLRPLLGKPLLVRMIERVRAARLVGTIVVATTTDPADDPIVTLCHKEEIHCYRGHPTDLLDRHVQVGWQFGADAIVKIPSDCPLIDPTVIDRVLAVYLNAPEAYDYVSNLHPATYPDGNDVEIIRMEALARAWREASRNFEREHTTPYLWERPTQFRLGNVVWETGMNYAMSHRWTIDYEPDYRFIKAVYEALYPQNPLFGLDDILQLLSENPALAALNEIYAGVNWYRHYLSDLLTITPDQTRQVALPIISGE